MTPTPTPTVILTPAPPAPQRTRTEYHDPTSETESHRPAATLSGIPLSEADQRYIDAWFEHDAQLSVLAQTLKVSLIELARWATQPHIQDTLREIGDAASLRTSTLRAEARHAAYARLHDITLGPDLAAARKAADRILRMDWLDARKANPAPGATAPSSGRAAPLPSSQNPECQQALGLASRPTPEPLPEGGVGVGSFDPPTPAPAKARQPLKLQI
jgi:hypothetical protein